MSILPQAPASTPTGSDAGVFASSTIGRMETMPLPLFDQWREESGGDTKHCKKCGELTPMDGFHLDRSRADGRHPYCKVCARAARLAVYWRDPERARENTREWKKNNPDKVRESNRSYCDANREAVRERGRRYENRNRERVNEQRRARRVHDNGARLAWEAAYRRANPDKIRKWQKQYQLNNADKIAEYRRRYLDQNRDAIKERKRKWVAANRDKKLAERLVRRSRKNNAPGFATSTQIAWRRDYYGGLCWMCGQLGTAIDHVIPLSRGGSNWPANLRPACKSCNSKKWARDWRLFHPTLGTRLTMAEAWARTVASEAKAAATAADGGQP